MRLLSLPSCSLPGCSLPSCSLPGCYLPGCSLPGWLTAAPCYCCNFVACSPLLLYLCCLQSPTFVPLLLAAPYCCTFVACSPLLLYLCCLQPPTVVPLLPAAPYCCIFVACSPLLLYLCCLQPPTVVSLLPAAPYSPEVTGQMLCSSSLSSVCRNGGTCVGNLFNGSMCQCPPAFTGIFCQDRRTSGQSAGTFRLCQLAML